MECREQSIEEFCESPHNYQINFFFMLCFWFGHSFQKEKQTIIVNLKDNLKNTGCQARLTTLLEASIAERSFDIYFECAELIFTT